MNPYEWAFQNPELIPAYMAFALFLLAWTWWSFHYIFRQWHGLLAGKSRWRGDPIPDYNTTKEVGGLMVVVGINLLLIGAYLYAVT